MKSVRIFFTKTGRMKFVSHLDMNRFMTRMVRKAEIPLWYTEGFNPHPYITFALPLSLGFESSYEIMDIRLNDDNFPLPELCRRLNAVFPEYVRVLNAAEPVLKTGKVAFASFEILFNDNGQCRDLLDGFLARPAIICSKTTKSGAIKEINLIEKIRNFDVSLINGNTKLSLVLPAGGQDNVNPTLLTEAFFAEYPQQKCPCGVTRTAISDENGELFR